jgi:RNA polymerase sigma-70 factor (ECF subfamily)
MQACIQPVTDAETDRALALRLAMGDARAVESFYQAHVDAIYQFAFFRVGRSREDAEDVTAEAFLHALRRIRDWEGRAPLRVWLRGIARNKCRERNKARVRRRTVTAGSLDPAVLDALADLESADLPQRLLESEETAEAVSAALSQIPEHYKRVLLSKYVDERTFVEIGAEEECSAKAAESMVQRAKRAFARVLDVMQRRERTRASHG